MPTLYPQDTGLLPQILYATSIISLGNTLSSFISPTSTKKVYNQATAIETSKVAGVQPLTSRVFGTWTLLSGLIRLYAAFNINDVHVYRITFLTFVLAGAHFLSEIFVFRTANLRGAVTASLAVASTLTIWMYLKWDEYIRT